MSSELIQYFFFGVGGVLCIFAIVIGLEKMVKMVIANFVLLGLCLRLSFGIDYFFQTYNLIFTSGMQTAQEFYNVISGSKITIVLLFYLAMLILIFTKSRFSISVQSTQLNEIIMTLLFVPITMISTFLVITTIILGTSIVDINQISALANTLTSNTYLYKFIILTPLRIVLEGIVVLIVLFDIRLDDGWQHEDMHE
jgi:hypothetical protein